MNYELIKLTKVLPTLNGKKIVEVFEERLEQARQAQYMNQSQASGFQPGSPKSPMTPKSVVISFRGKQDYKNKSMSLKKDNYVSSSRLQGSAYEHKLDKAMEGYDNLKELLKGNKSEQDLAAMFKEKRKPKNASMQMNSSSSSFAKGEFTEGVERPVTGANPPSNFVFRKKKIVLRKGSELDHVYHYVLGRGLNFHNEDVLGLHGHRAMVKELEQSAIVKEQKRFWKNMKYDPMNTFHSPFRNTELETSGNFGSGLSPIVEKVLSVQTGTHKPKKSPTHSTVSFINHSDLIKEELNSKMKASFELKSASIDGSKMRLHEIVKTPSSPNFTPGKTAKSFFG